MMITYTFILYILLPHILAGNLLIQKCCKESGVVFREAALPFCKSTGVYGENETGVTRVSVNTVSTKDNPDFPWWMDARVPPLSPDTLAPVPSFLRDQSSDAYIEFGALEDCPQGIRFTIHSTDETYHILHNGSLIFQYGGENLTFDPTSYCVDWSVSDDELKTSHIYNLCPCAMYHCLPYCCKNFGVPYLRTICDNKDSNTTEDNSDVEKTAISLTGSVYKCKFVRQRRDENLSLSLRSGYGLVLLMHNSRPSSEGGFSCVLVQDGTNETHHQFVHCEEQEAPSATPEPVDEAESFSDSDPKSEVILRVITALISAFTLGVYLFVPKIRQREFKIVGCHLICALVAEIIQAVYQVRGDISTDIFFLLQVISVQIFPVSTLLWLNVLCYDVALASRGDYVSYSVYVWGVAAIHVTYHYIVLIILEFDYTTDYYKTEYVLGLPLVLGVVNTLLLSYATIKCVLQRRASGKGATPHSQGTFPDRRRKLLTYLNLLLLPGVVSTVEALTDIQPMKVLRALSVLIFVLLKPELLNSSRRV